MKRKKTNLFKMVAMILAMTALTVSMAQADVKKGQKIYLKSFKSKFHASGAKFAAEHTQDEWEELFEDKGEGFIDLYSEKFPKAEKFLENPKNWKKLEHVRDFVIEYASDSGNVPSCG